MFGKQRQFSANLTRELGQYTRAVLGVTAGSNYSVRLALRREKDKSPLSAEVVISQEDLELSLSKTKSISKHSSIRIAGKVGTYSAPLCYVDDQLQPSHSQLMCS